MLLPGDVFKVADNHYAGTDIGGRVLAINGNKVTLDREIEIDSKSYFTYINAEAKHRSIKISAVNGAEITLGSTPTGLTEYGVWSLSTEQVQSALYKVVSIAENDDGTYAITGLQHEPQKEQIVDNSAHFEPKQTTLHNLPQLTHVDVATGFDGKLYVNTETKSGDSAVTYDVKLLKDGALYDYQKGLDSPNIALDNLPNGQYSLIIYVKNEQGQIIHEKSKDFVIDKPPVPTGVNIIGGLGNITLEWDWVDTQTQTEIFVNEEDNFATAKRLAKVNERMYTHVLTGSKQIRYYWLRHTRGQNSGAFYQEQGLRGESAVDLDAKLAELNEELSRNIVDDVINTALPARNLELTKTVESLDLNQFIGHKQVYNLADSKLYIWNGTKYVTDAQEILASAIQGIIQPSQLASIPTAQLSGTISANQIAANSIGTNALQANAVSADKIQANAITSAKIMAGAINADHLQAGQISADKLAIGLGGNLLYNPIFANPTNNRPDGWNNQGVGGQNSRYGTVTTPTENTFSRGLPNENSVYLRINGTSKTDYSEFWQPVNVTPNKWYIASVFLGTWDSVKTELLISLRDKNNTEIKVISKIGTKKGFFNLNMAERVFLKFQTPSNCTKINFVIRCTGVIDNEDWSIARFARPMLEECTEHATQPSAWQNAGVTSIHGGSIKTRTITAEHLAANTITANEIASGAITANHIATNSISANHIASRAISADKLNVTSLSAVSSNIGNITAGSITGVRLEGNTINGNTITGGTITGTTISGGVITGTTIKGSTIEGVTVRAENVIGDIVKIYAVDQNSSIDIPAVDFPRKIVSLPFSANVYRGIDNSQAERKRRTKDFDITLAVNNLPIFSWDTRFGSLENKMVDGVLPKSENIKLTYSTKELRGHKGTLKASEKIYFLVTKT